MYANDELISLLDSLIGSQENEVVEFKEARTRFDREKIGEYVSALSNEANLRGFTSGWLVFGVTNAGQAIGTSLFTDAHDRQSLKQQVYQSIEPRLTIREIHEVVRLEKRVLLIEIPAAPRGMPISWKGHYFARAGDSLVALSMDKLEQIRRQTIDTDWTAVVVPGATLEHLDPAAMTRARQGFAERHSPRIAADEISSWDDATFLERARLTRDGQITKAALLLLGAETSTHLLNPHLAEMTWKLVGEQRAYEHFHLPFLLTTSELAKRIRNVQLRLLPPNIGKSASTMNSASSKPFTTALLIKTTAGMRESSSPSMPTASSSRASEVFSTERPTITYFMREPQ